MTRVDDETTRRGGRSQRMNWLRAGVLGANDGIISTAGLVVGVAAVGVSREPIIIAGIAGLVAGAVSMALGEYVSVSAQRDSERALLAGQRADLASDPEKECAELAAIYRRKGLSDETAKRVAEELTTRDAYAAHVDAELGIDPDALTNPWHAALASAVAFTVGALFPLVAILLAPDALLVPVTVVIVIVALVVTGTISAALGGAKRTTAALRLVAGGAAAMAVTWSTGQLLGLTTA
jgi:VIT1/CCC1 family predicted Fe2+/Mn2+ transporter